VDLAHLLQLRVQHLDALLGQVSVVARRRGWAWQPPASPVIREPGIGDACGPGVDVGPVAEVAPAARMAEAVARSGKLRCFLASLPVKIRWSRVA